jgi:cytochrome c oxidase subunit 4
MMTVAADRQAHDAPPHPGLGTLMLIYVVLMVLLGLTILAAAFPLGAIGLIIALAIAAAKAILVVLFFMHVKYQPRAIAVFAATSLLWLGILLTLTLSDYIARGWLPRSEELPDQPHVIPPPRGVQQATREGETFYLDNRRSQ